MRNIRTKSRSLLGLAVAAVSGVVSLTNMAHASDPRLIPKPAPLNSLGQEAGWSADLAGDFSLMGAYMLGERFADSGGAYLFDTGNFNARQTFRLTGPVTLNHTHYGIGGDGKVFASPPTQCTFTEAQVNGAYLGDRVTISSQWVALAAYDLGHANTPPHEVANCAGQPGSVPAVFLAKRLPSGSPFPYSTLNYNFNVPFRERVQAMDISDTDLVLVGSGNGAHIFSYNASQDKWNFNKTVLFAEDLRPEFGQIVSIDDDTIVIGNKDASKVHVYRKQAGVWAFLTEYQSSRAGFGRAVDVKDDLLAVGSDEGVDFFAITGNSLTHINGILGTGVKYVAINGEYAAGIEDNQSGYAWQYRNNPAGGGYYKSGTLGGGAVDLNGNVANWGAHNLEIDGVRMLSGFKGYGNGTQILIGSVIFDSIKPLFAGTNTIDNAEGDRLWLNRGKYDWRRHHGPTPTSGTGPDSGATGSQNYYYVETSQGEGAYYQGDDAILESDYLSTNSRVDFDFHMYGSTMGTLYVEVLENRSNATWRPILTLDGSQSWIRSTSWQRRGVGLNGYVGPVRVRFRYVARGGAGGDVGLDNIVVNRN
ncbi:MAG TPA: hypothetical protein VFQ61_36470 [Polyangiaceae bacterium]|nr:hypothetical protein [Polyangiaceae bacterium]